MRVIRALFLLIIPVAVAAHPGGGLIALDANTVIFGDSMYNAVWRLEKGKKPQALVKNFHAHWTTRGLDGQIYSESFQEMGGALFRIDLGGGKPVKVAEESDLETRPYLRSANAVNSSSKRQRRSWNGPLTEP